MEWCCSFIEHSRIALATHDATRRAGSSFGALASQRLTWVVTCAYAYGACSLCWSADEADCGYSALKLGDSMAERRERCLAEVVATPPDAHASASQPERELGRVISHIHLRRALSQPSQAIAELLHEPRLACDVGLVTTIEDASGKPWRDFAGKLIRLATETIDHEQLRILPDIARTAIPSSALALMVAAWHRGSRYD